FSNFGVGGDLAYNALQRLPRVVAAHPEKVVILLGANDVLTLVFRNVRRLLGGWMKRIPREPSPEWFRECLETIVRWLTRETRAQIGLCSLGQIGEDPGSTHPVQRELNLRFEQYNGIIQGIAREQSATYLPFYERLREQIMASPGRAFTEFRFLPMYRD